MKKTIYPYLFFFLFYFPLQSYGQQKILIIESYHSDFKWDLDYKKGIRSILKDDFELHYFAMDTKRIPQYKYQDKANQAWDFYKKLKPDLVILGDDNAVQYLSKYFMHVNTPVIYLGLNNNPRHYNIHQSKNISGVLERPLLKRAIPMIAQIIPKKLQRVLIMFDNSPIAHTIIKEVFANKTQIEISTIKVDIKHISTWSQWQNTLLMSADNNYDAIFIGLFYTLKDRKGKHIPEEQVLNWSVKNAPIPPFGFWEHSVGKDKNIGGLVISGYEQGKLAAKMSKEVLQNKVEPYHVKSKTADKGHYVFSRDGLQKYGLTLPENIAKKTTYID